MYKYLLIALLLCIKKCSANRKGLRVKYIFAQGEEERLCPETSDEEDKERSQKDKYLIKRDI